MWFKTKQKNRRLSRGHVLDVKLRSGQVRATRFRLAALAAGLLFATVFSIYLLWRLGEWGLDRLVYENRTFAIRTLDAQTDGLISPDQLRTWAGVKLGQNLFATDLARVKRDLELVSLIQSVSVERVLPGTLRIRVTEREPVAQVNVPHVRAGGGIEFTVFHLDQEGYMMIPLDPRQRITALEEIDTPLPLLTGIKMTDLQPGRRLESPQVQSALNLIAEFSCSPMAGMVDLRGIDVGTPEVVVATTGQGSEVTFGLQNLDRQLRRWREIHDLGQRMKKNVASLDLAVTNNIPLRWLEATAPPPAPAKIPKVVRNKRKHV